MGIYCPVLPLFPNIQDLYCSSISMLEHIEMFLGPELSRFMLHRGTNDPSPQSLGRLFTCISSTCPSMECLRICPTDPIIRTSEISTEFTNMTQSLPSLRSLLLVIIPASVAILSHLSRIRGLEELTLRVEHEPDSSHVPAGFPSLEILSIDMSSLEYFPSLLKLITSTELFLVDLHPDTTPNARAVHTVFRALADHPCRSDFEKIMISESNEWWLQTIPPTTSTSYAHTITIHTISPLLELRHMRTVSICLPCLYEIDNAAIRDMALSWPRIKTLNLLLTDMSGDGLSNTRVTASGLIPLAAQCPQLQYLSIAFDASQNDIAEANRLLDGRSIKLFSLTVGNSPITRPTRKIAEFLICLFGNVPNISWASGTAVEETMELWMHVKAWLHNLQYPEFEGRWIEA